MHNYFLQSQSRPMIVSTFRSGLDDRFELKGHIRPFGLNDSFELKRQIPPGLSRINVL